MLKKEPGADFRATLSLPVAGANKNLSHPLERATGNVNYVPRQLIDGSLPISLTYSCPADLH